MKSRYSTKVGARSSTGVAETLEKRGSEGCGFPQVSMDGRSGMGLLKARAEERLAAYHMEISPHYVIRSSGNAKARTLACFSWIDAFTHALLRRGAKLHSKTQIFVLVLRARDRFHRTDVSRCQCMIGIRNCWVSNVVRARLPVSDN